MITLYISLVILVLVFAMASSNWVSLRAVSIKVTFFKALQLTLVLVVLQAVAGLLSYVLGDNPLSLLVWITWLVGAFIVWHKLLNRYYAPVSIGRSLGAYLVAGIISTVVSVVIALGAVGFVQSYKIEGNTMNPALRNGDTVLTYKRGKQLEVNKIAIYDYVNNEKNVKAIGRILDIPGQTISIKTDYVGVDGTLVKPSDYTLKDGEYYIVADNRENTTPRIVRADDIVAIVGPTLIRAK
jgi:signal peptidase I